MMIEHSKRADNTPAFALIAEGWNELVQDGLTPDGVGVCPVEPDDEVFYMVSQEGDIVGVVTYGLDGPAYLVSLAYVEPSTRKRGVFKAMLGSVKAAASAHGIDRVEIELPGNNAVFRAALTRLGMEVVSATYGLACAPQGA